MFTFKKIKSPRTASRYKLELAGNKTNSFEENQMN
jgi:hypothetical protein